LVLLLARARWQVETAHAGGEAHGEAGATVPFKTILLWLVLAAVPSGLMLSTTTHLTTDILAMPLLWVLPLGLYLLSFVPAFSERRTVTQVLTRVAPIVVLLVGGLAMVPQSVGGLTIALSTVVMLFVVAVALHGKLYDLRPDPSRLTLFYLVMSAGGVLGGMFTALIAPLLFDWVWEHPILVLATAALLPLGGLFAWQQKLEESERWRLPSVLGAILLASVLAATMAVTVAKGMDYVTLAIFVAMAWLAVLVKFHRFAFIMILLLMMLGRGGGGHLNAYDEGDRTRSYFGVYNIKDIEQRGVRVLTHGTTVHGGQFLAPDRQREPTSYYGRSAGVGLVLDNAVQLFGTDADVGIVGLGAGTLACYREPEQTYRYYEIDPAVLAFSDQERFTFLSQCSPEAETVIGDARLALEQEPAGQFDVLVVDAFSSDAIPLHLLTREAFGIYNRAIRDDGALLIHISNRFLDLQPVLASAAEECGCEVALRRDDKLPAGQELSQSDWVVMTRDPAVMARIKQATGADLWQDLNAPLDEPWTDDYASILPLIKWKYLMGIH
jgi:hypothetical protein